MSNNHESWQTVISRRFGYYGPTLYGCRMREFLSAVLLTSICLCYSRGQELRPSGWSLQTPYQNPTGERQVTLGGHTSTLDPAAAQALDSSALQAVITRAIQANNCGGAGAVVFYDGPSTWPGDMTLNSYFATTVGAVPAQSLGCHMNAQYAPSLGDPPNTHLLQLVQTNSANYVNRAGVTWAVRNGSWYYFIDNVNRAGGCEFSLANPLVVDDTPHADPNIEPLIAWFIIMPFYVDGQGAFHVDASQGLWYGFDLN